MSVAPIIRTVEVKAPPARAFELFTSRMGEWWPRGTTLSKDGHRAIVIEPRVEGRWFERDAAGAIIEWGKVLAWEPPSRLLLAWQLGSDWRYHADLITEVELTFTEAANGGAVVTFEHRHLERLGVDGAKVADMLRGGWPSRVDSFAAYADAQT